MNQKKSKALRAAFTLKPYLIVLPILLTATIETSHALQLDVRNHWARDYMDMGQNKGIFKRGATGIKLMRKDGSILELPDVPFPDMSVVANFGSVTSIGGAYGVTATHNKKFGPWHFSVAEPKFGQTTYNVVGSIDVGGSDFSALRFNKFVVETTGLDTGIDTSLNHQAFIERYGVMYQGQKQVIAYRAGNGRLIIQDHGGTTSYMDVKYIPAMLSASLFKYAIPESANYFGFKQLTSLNNTTTEGDSGSGIFIWDNKLNKWVIAGVLNGIAWSSVNGNYFRYAKWNQKHVDELKARYTHKVNLEGKTLTFDGTDTNKFTIDGKEESFGANKDLSFTGGGDIVLSKNLHLGHGGLIFDEEKSYQIKGQDPNYNFKGAGVDIGKGTTVNWHIKGSSDDNLHKIGEGTLDVKVAQGNNLKVGNGTVILGAEKTFNNIYMANGKATIRLEHANALNKNDDKGRNGIFFARYGGILDLNGYDQTFARIAASDDGAVITNTDKSHRAEINFALPKWSYAYHGRFEGNLNIKHKYQDEASAETKHKERHLILDGGMDIDGYVAVENAKLTMQGLPSVHAYFGNGWCNAPKFNIKCPRDYIGDFRNRDQAANDRWNSHYKNNNQTSSFIQPDWETRTFKFKKLNLNKSDVAIGRNTRLFADIDAKDSNIQFGGNVTLFRDEHAGNNVTGFDFQQKLHEGTSEHNDSIYYEGEIAADNSKIISYASTMTASFDLSNNSTFEAKNKDSITYLSDKGIKLQDKSTLILGKVIVQDIKAPMSFTKLDDSTLSIEDVAVKNATLNLPNDVVKGSLSAFKDGTINVDKWNLKEGNLFSEDNGMININSLDVAGVQNVPTANITINNKLQMNEVNPHTDHAGDSQWIGLNANHLILKENSTVSAQMSNDYMSLSNLGLNKEHTLLQANKLEDLRNNKRIDFILQGEALKASSNQIGNKIVFVLGNNSAYPGPEVDDEHLNDLLNSPVGQAFLAQNSNGKELLHAVLTHNSKDTNKYQEAAIIDAMSMSDVNEGVTALNNIVRRTDSTFKETARTLSQSSLVQPIRSAITSRLSSLRRAARNPSAPAPLTAALGNFYGLPKAKEEDILLDSVYVDVNGALQKEGSRTEHLISSNIGMDTVRTVPGGRVVVGGAFSFTKVHNTDTSSRDSGKMYSLSGYLSYEQKSGWEYQSYLTAGILDNHRNFVPEISLGRQNFYERSYMLMSSNYIKYHHRMDGVSVRPMALVDIGWTRTEDSTSEFFKRDTLDQATVDLGFGLELEGSYESVGYSFQATARHNFWTSTKAVDINLRSADGYMSYDIPNNSDVMFNVQGSISKRIKHNISLDLGVGASATTGGAKGINGNARVRWHF